MYIYTYTIIITTFRPFCDKLSVATFWSILNHLDPFHVYKFTGVLIGLNNKQ